MCLGEAGISVFWIIKLQLDCLWLSYVCMSDVWWFNFKAMLACVYGGKRLRLM